MRRHNLIQRHQDYVMNIGTLTPGQLLIGLPLPLDPDAPFCLRQRALRCQYNASRQQAGLGGVAMRFTGPSAGDYRQQALIPQGLCMAYFGQQGSFKAVSPEIEYPQSGTILVDVQNIGSTTLTNLQLFFRGVKLFLPGAVRSYTYPPRFATQPYIYSSLQSNTIVPNLAVSTPAPGVRQIFRPKPDSDFVLRSITWGQVPGVQPFEVFVTLQDEDNKPYSNAPVHIDLFSTNPATGATYPCGPGYVAPYGTGGQNPAVFFPEIYVQRNHILYYDVARNDGGFSGQVPVNLPFQFNGAKVFTR